MNLLFMSLLYHPSEVAEVSELSRTGLQNQANSFEWAMIEGIRQNQQNGEKLIILNSLPVGIWPKLYRKLILKSKQYNDDFIEIGSINLPYFKQKKRNQSAAKEIVKWAKQSADNRTILLYSLYLPYMRAIAKAKKSVPDLKACVIITDLPGHLGLSSGRQGFLKKLETKMGEESIRLCQTMDGYVLLTKQMAEPLGVSLQKSIIIEGLITSQSNSAQSIETPDDSRPAVLYTGTLNRELGIDHLISAFEIMQDYQLWICGKGDMELEIEQAQKKHDHIHYYGFVSQAQAIDLQKKAAALINPRTSQGEYTRYSFPSKTLEYMRSGKPVLCYKLDGIPSEYDEYLQYIKSPDSKGIQEAVLNVMKLSQAQRDTIGRHAREFVLSKKNNITQGEKALEFLRTI